MGANRLPGRPQGSVDRRRARGHPALLRRVRWGNVGRLAALLAAGTLIATGGRSCGEEPAGAPPEELGAGPDRRERERVENPLDRAGKRAPKDRDGARRARRGPGGKPAERRRTRRQGPERWGAERRRAERRRAERRRAERQAAKRPAVKRERREPQSAESVDGSPEQAPSVPPPATGEAGPPSSYEAGPPVSGEAGPPVGVAPPGGAERITPPDGAPRAPTSGEFTPDPAP
jgi:hypothetical protein